MFTKKPYGPVNCASCEKNIVNLQANPVDYHVWRKMPIRENTTDRIAKYGPGFSKILSNLKPEGLHNTSIDELPDLKTHVTQSPTEGMYKTISNKSSTNVFSTERKKTVRQSSNTKSRPTLQMNQQEMILAQLGEEKKPNNNRLNGFNSSKRIITNKSTDTLPMVGQNFK